MMQQQINDILVKNNGYKTLNTITKILSGEITSMDGLPEDLKDLKLYKILFFCFKMKKKKTKKENKMIKKTTKTFNFSSIY